MSGIRYNVVGSNLGHQLSAHDVRLDDAGVHDCGGVEEPGEPDQEEVGVARSTPKPADAIARAPWEDSRGLPG
jgi:hypothetical protein